MTEQPVTRSHERTASHGWKHTRLEHRSRQRAAIAASALALVVERGAPALSMAAIAEAAEVSRQTLYRYYDDVDSVLVGVAELVTSHDETFAKLVAEQPGPRAQLDLITTATTARGHDEHDVAALVALLPPAGRDVVARHRARSCVLLAEVLQRGVDEGTFDRGISPRTDAPLVLGLLKAADPDEPERAIALVHRLVEPIERSHHHG